MISITTLLKKLDTELLFTESDSLTYETKSEHIYEEFFKYKQLFGCSEYQSKFFDLLTKKLLAK